MLKTLRDFKHVDYFIDYVYENIEKIVKAEREKQRELRNNRPLLDSKQYGRLIQKYDIKERKILNFLNSELIRTNRDYFIEKLNCYCSNFDKELCVK